jgi:fumarate hydratase subunit beta
MTKLTFPFTEEKIRALKVGDEVLISGIVFTGRDAVHKYLHEGGKLPPEVKLRDGIHYHCGPVMMKQDDGSLEMHRRRPDHVHPRGAVSMAGHPRFRDSRRHRQGRHGRPKTQAACKEYGCVYLHAVGGAAQVLADCVKKVRNVYLMKEFGAPEAIWELEVVDFPAVVTMDSHGNSLHEEIFTKSQAALAERLKPCLPADARLNSWCECFYKNRQPDGGVSPMVSPVDLGRSCRLCVFPVHSGGDGKRLSDVRRRG